MSDVGLSTAADFVQLSDELDALKRQKEVIEEQIKALKAALSQIFVWR